MASSAKSPELDGAQEATTELVHRPKPCSGSDETSAPSDPTPNSAADGDVAESAVKNDVPDEDPAGKKKKKKSKGRGGKKKKKKITGFEENYAEAPLTPAQHEEEKVLYDRSFPAIRRLETAIQRFQAKRRMDNNRSSVFTKYMSYGGVEVGPKMFEGNDPRDIEDMDADDIITATAESSIPEDRSEWQVDFDLVAKGFFSSTLPRFFALDTQEEIDMATSTIKNFLNYILYHNVCPEYEPSILAARRVCGVASNDLRKAQQAGVWAPGDFNMACSTLFGGAYTDAYTGDQDWIKENDGIAGMPSDAARKVVKFALAGAGSYEQAFRFRELANANALEAQCVDENGFEVLAITPPVREVRDFYKQHARDLKPVGKVLARPWRDPGLPDEDMPPGEIPPYMKEDGDNNKMMEYEFFVEESILELYFVGMKVDASIWRLNCGMHYFDKVVGVYCSFYTVLPNEDMVGWKRPRDLRSDELVFAEGGADAAECVSNTAPGTTAVEDEECGDGHGHGHGHDNDVAAE